MRHMLVGNSQRFSVEFGVEIHLDCSLRVLSIEIALLSLSVVTSLKVELCLVKEHFGDTLGVELASDLEGRVPVLLMLVHVDGLLWLIRLDEFLLGFFQSVLILEVKGVLQVNFRELVLGMAVCKRESLIEFLLVGFKINSRFNETVLEQELSALLSPHILSHLNSDFS